MATEQPTGGIRDLDVYMESQRLAVMATAAIEQTMEIAGLNRSQLAETIGVSKPRVTKVLDGETNMTLRTLAQFGLACGVRWQFVGVKANDPCTIVTAPESLLESLGSPYFFPDSRSEIERGDSSARSGDAPPFELAA